MLTCGCGPREAGQSEPADGQHGLEEEVLPPSSSHPGSVLPEREAHRVRHAALAGWNQYTGPTWRQTEPHAHTQTWDRQCQNGHTPASPHSSAASSPVASPATTTQGRADRGMKILPLSCLCPAAQRLSDGWNFILGTQNSFPSRMKLFS